MEARNIGTQSLDRYVTQIQKYPLLSREQEFELAERYRTTGDVSAAHELVRANLRFVVKIAHEYRGYKLRLLDLIQEGNIGLIMATKKFDASKGYRLISYAVWWIRAYIQSYIIRSWSLVKVGTTQAQRKLFFKLRSARSDADRARGPGQVASTEELADQLGVAETEVASMEMRLASRDFSLDVAIDDGARQTHLDQLQELTESQEESLAREEARNVVRRTVGATMSQLNEKEGYIVRHRLLSEEPETLQQIGKRFRISRERARQIEGNVLRKIRSGLRERGMDAAA